MTNQSLIAKWYQGTQGDRVGWFLKCVNPSGNFFGEITYFSKQFQKTISGTMVEADVQALYDIVDEIRQYTSQTIPLADRVGWTGLLAVGTIARPEILLQYHLGDEELSKSAQLFIKIINILQKYVDR